MSLPQPCYKRDILLFLTVANATCYTGTTSVKQVCTLTAALPFELYCKSANTLADVVNEFGKYISREYNLFSTVFFFSCFFFQISILYHFIVQKKNGKWTVCPDRADYHWFVDVTENHASFPIHPMKDTYVEYFQPFVFLLTDYQMTKQTINLGHFRQSISIAHCERETSFLLLFPCFSVKRKRVCVYVWACVCRLFCNAETFWLKRRRKKKRIEEKASTCVRKEYTLCL